MRLEPTKLISVGRRTTYQATGDAGFAVRDTKPVAPGGMFSVGSPRTHKKVDCVSLNTPVRIFFCAKIDHQIAYGA